MKKRIHVILISFFLVACTTDVSVPTGTFIVNARVVDGSGGASQNVNIRIVADRIESIGGIEPIEGDEIVDATGLVLTPGFVDTHSHHDIGLSDEPGALAAVSQGITTIVVGQDGGLPNYRYPLASFFADFEASPVAVNVASYAGHGTLRNLVMGDDYKRHATEEEIFKMVELLRIEMESGALGFGSGLEYDPGLFSATEEVIALAHEASRHGGRYISHIRSEDVYFWDALAEIIRIGREADIPVQISHVKLAMNPWWGQADVLVEILDAARESGVDITADIYPYRAWNTSLSWLETLFPDRDLDNRAGAEFILRELLSPETIVIPKYVPDPSYDGMTVGEIAGIREMDAETTLMDLLKAERALSDDSPSSDILGIAMQEADIEKIMAWPHTVIGSDGELAGVHPRGFGAFSRYLGHYLRERQVLSLEEGVRRMTSLSAQQVGIHDRGLIAVGRPADLVLFDPARVIDRSTIENPHLPSNGIEKVWVNGQLVFADGKATGNRPGSVIRRPQGD